MPGQCTRAVKARRAAEAQQVCAELHRAYLRSCIGQTFPVLFETEENGFCTGHSDTYVLVRVPGTKLRNQILRVGITGIDGEELKGEIQT